MGFRKLLVSGVALLSALAGNAYAQIPNPFRRDRETQAAPAERLIDRIREHLIELPTQEAISLRFRDGRPRFGPRSAITIHGGAFSGHEARINEIMARLLAAYPGPKPESVPFRIVQQQDINCMVVPQDDGSVQRPAQSGLASLFNTPSSTGSAQRQQGQNATAQQPAAGPRQLEMRCTLQALDQVEDDSEMAFLIAHELSHILLGHWERQEATARRDQAISDLATVAALGLLLSKSDYTRYGNQIRMTANNEATTAAAVALGTGLAMTEFNQVIVAPSWGREQEREADLLALDLMAEARITRATAPGLLDKFERAEAELKSERASFLQEMFSSAAGGALLSLSQGGGGNRNTLASAGINMGLTAYRRFRDSRLQRFHDDSKTRAQLINAYVARHPGEAEAASASEQAQASNFFAARRSDNYFATHRFADVSQAYRQAQAIQDAVKDRQCEGVRTQAEALEAAPRRDRYVSAALAGWRLCVHDVPRARQHAEASIAPPPRQRAANAQTTGATDEINAPWFVQAIEIQLIHNDHVAALRTIGRAEVEAPPITPYIVPRIRALLLAENKPAAEARARQCAAEETGGLPDECMRLVGLTRDGQPLPAVDPNADQSNQSLLNTLLGRSGGTATAPAPGESATPADAQSTPPANTPRGP